MLVSGGVSSPRVCFRWLFYRFSHGKSPSNYHLGNICYSKVVSPHLWTPSNLYQPAKKVGIPFIVGEARGIALLELYVPSTKSVNLSPEVQKNPSVTDGLSVKKSRIPFFAVIFQMKHSRGSINSKDPAYFFNVFCLTTRKSTTTQSGGFGVLMFFKAKVLVWKFWMADGCVVFLGQE